MKNSGIQWKKLWIYAVLMIVLVLAEIYAVRWAEGHLTQQVQYHQSDAMDNIYNYTGYNKINHKYMMINNDPQIYVKNTIPSTNRVVVRFVDRFQQDAKFQVYYQEEGRMYQERNSTTVFIKAGEDEAVADIPLNHYSELRLDIDGSFTLEALDFYAVNVKDTACVQFIIRLMAILLLAGIVFFVYKKDGDFFQQLSAGRQSRHMDGRYAEAAFQGKNDRLWHFLVIYLPMALLAFLFLHSLYLNPGRFERFKKSDSDLVKDVRGYQKTKTGYQYQKDRTCSLILAGGNDIDKVLLDATTPENRDIPVEYRIIGKNGMSGEKKELLWEQGRGAMLLDLEHQSCVGIEVAIPADFTLQEAFYINRMEEPANRYVYHLLVQLLLMVFAVYLVSIGVGKKVSYTCMERLRQIRQRAVENRKKLLLSFAVFAAVTLLGILVLKLLCMGQLCQWSTKSLLFSVMVSWMAAVLLFCNQYFSHKVETIGFMIILLMGSLFALLAPANLGLSWDDQIHYGYVENVSSMGKGVKAYSENILDEYVYIPRLNYDRKQQANSYDILDTLEKEGCYGAQRNVEWNNFPTWVPYVPSAVGIMVARGLGLPFHMQVIAGRWMNVWLLALLCYVAMKNLKKGKIVVLLVALIPTNIFIASNYTYDTWLTGWTILGVSLFMGEWQQPDKKITAASMLAITGAMCLAVTPKMVYFPITLLVLFMPKAKFHSKKQRYGYYALVFAAMLLPFVFLYLKTFGSSGGAATMADMRGGATVNAQGQIDYIKSHFGAFASTLFQFLSRYLNPIANGEYLSFFAYVSQPSAVFDHLVLWTLVIGACYHHEDTVKIPWWYRAGALCVYAGVGIICSVSMYIMFTPVGASEIAGCQGRYLLPAIFPVVYTLTRIPVTTKVKLFLEEKGISRVVDVILVGILLYVSTAAVWTYYVMQY